MHTWHSYAVFTDLCSRVTCTFLSAAVKKSMGQNEQRKLTFSVLSVLRFIVECDF
jgi:hypothetical protein